MAKELTKGDIAKLAEGHRTIVYERGELIDKVKAVVVDLTVLEAIVNHFGPTTAENIELAKEKLGSAQIVIQELRDALTKHLEAFNIHNTRMKEAGLK